MPRLAASARRALARALALAACAAMLGCPDPVPDVAPWFCEVQGVDADDALRLMQRRQGPRTPGAARAVLTADAWRGCWGNAALALGAAAPEGAEALLLDRVDRIAAAPGSPLEADALLAGLALTVRQSDDGARIAAVVDALVERADPTWWAARHPDDAQRPADRRRSAEIRARAALFALAYSGTRRAAAALETLRAAPPGTPTHAPPEPAVFADLVRRNRLWHRQPPGQIGR